MVRPFMSAGFVCGSASVSWWFFLSSRTMSDPFQVPTHMFPLIMKQSPPNILRSETLPRFDRI